MAMRDLLAPAVATALAVSALSVAGCSQEGAATADATADPPPMVASGPPGDRPGKPIAPPSGGDATAVEADDLRGESADALVDRSSSVFSPDERIRLLQAALEQDPRHRPALAMLMETTQRKAIDVALNQRDRPASNPYFLASARAARSLIDAHGGGLGPQEQNLAALAFFNEACTLAITDRPEEAVAALDEAVEAGFSDPSFHTDGELDSLRDREDFAVVLAKFERLRGGDAQADDDEPAGVEDNEPDGVEDNEPDGVEDNEGFEPFPFSFSLPDLDGKTVSLDDYKGKVVVVDIWGTWCPPCRAEVPELVKLQEKYGEDGLQIIGINYEGVEQEEAVKTIKSFAEEYGINYPCVLGDDAVQQQVPNFSGYPTTIFIDRNGTVRAMEVGFAPHMAPKLEATVKTLLDEKAGDGDA